MATYPRLASLLTNAASRNQVIPYLYDVWLGDYRSTAAHSKIVEVTIDHCTYLFDIAAERLIAAWAVSNGRHAGARDASRMAGHPSAGPKYDRGHVIPHIMGGSLDINLVRQISSVNRGQFRVLERRAADTPGSLYFTYWSYRSKSGQRPITVDQGFVMAGQQPEIRTFAN